MRGQREERSGGQGKDDFGYGGLADPAEGEAGDLVTPSSDGGEEELIDGVFELEGSAGARTAEGDQLLDASLADADQGELGSHKEAAGQNEKGHHHNPEEHPLEHYGKCNGWIRFE